MSHLILKRGELVSIAIALLMLLGICAFTAFDWIEYRQSRGEVLRARRIFEHTNALLLAVTDAETGERGFLLTENPSYLEPYQRALETVPGELDIISSADHNAAYQGQVRKLRALVDAKVAELKHKVELVQHGEREASVAGVKSGEGTSLMTAVRAAAGEIHEQKSSLIERRSEQVRERSDRAHLLTLLSCGALLVLLALGSLTISAATTRREQLIADIETERGQTAEVRDLLQVTLDSIGDAVLVTDTTGSVTFLNRVAENLTGWSARQATGVSESQVVRMVDEATGTSVESPVRGVLEGTHKAGISNHSILIARDGRETPIDDSGAAIRGHGGSTLGAVVVFRDVTNRRAAEREREQLLAEAWRARADAERQRSHLHSLFQQAPAIINIHRGPKHVYELVHPRTGELLGGRDVTGIKASDVIRNAGYVEILDQVYRNGESRLILEMPFRKDESDSELYFNYVCCPWREEGGAVAGVMTLAIEVTEQVRVRQAMKASEEQLRETARLESLGVLAGGIAHDFNNLLVGIIGNASMALESIPADRPVHEMISDVLRAGERAATLTRQMLAYAGKGRFVIESVDLSSAVEEILPLIQGSMPKTVAIRTLFARGLPMVEADASQLHQVFMNLVINAAEACGERSGQVEIETARLIVDEHYIRTTPGMQELAPGVYVSLEVSDNGCGMNEATRSKIFDPFFTTKFTGRGLGLSAVLGIIRAHKGAVRVYSEPGEGSSFRVLLPAIEVPATRAEELPAVLLPESRGHGMVLLADDEEVVRRMGGAALTQLGYRVIEAENGREALERFISHRDEIDLVILDLTMPLMSGEETLRRLRAIDPDVIVILSSGFNESDAIRHFEDGKLAGFLQKPYTVARLREQLRLALGVSA